jgi:acetylglutamate kinase
MTGPNDPESGMEALRRALPYLRLYKGRTFVVKVGGAICGDLPALRGLAEQLAVLWELGIRIVLVHGGGPQTTALASALGLETTLINGRRVTCEKTLDVAVMTLNGAVRTAILAACRGVDLPAIGLSGVDAGLIRARRRPPQVEQNGSDPAITVDYGLVGDLVSVNAAVLGRLLDAELMPVVSPLSADDSGQVLNVNADTVAASIARELKAEKLIFITDTPGLLEDPHQSSSLVSYTDLAGLRALEERGAIAAGMLPKIKATMEALLGGVRRVHMVGAHRRSGLLVEIFTNEGAGTLIVRDRAELQAGEVTQGEPAGRAAGT